MKINKKTFFNLYRKHLDKDGRLTQEEVDALDTFLDLVEHHWDYFTLQQWAYVFATTFHETAHSFTPVKEGYYLQERYKWTNQEYENWAKKYFRYYPYYGRGFVQITWKANYAKFSKYIGVDLVKNPTQALDFGTAFFILIRGMRDGMFTGKKVSDYINSERKRYDLARYVVNGKDKRDTIAVYAKKFEFVLKSCT